MQSSSPLNHRAYRYQDPYLNQQKEASLKYLDYHYKRSLSPSLFPYEEVYYDLESSFKKWYRPFQGYEEETNPRNEEYPMYLQNQPK